MNEEMTDGGMADGWTDGWTDECMEKWTGGRTGRWMDGWEDGFNTEETIGQAASNTHSMTFFLHRLLSLG